MAKELHLSLPYFCTRWREPACPSIRRVRRTGHTRTSRVCCFGSGRKFVVRSSLMNKRDPGEEGDHFGYQGDHFDYIT